MKRRLVNLLKAVVAAAIGALLCWYGISNAGNMHWLTITVIALTALGVTYSASGALFKAASETKGGIMVIAEFLNRHLLEPQKQRLLEQGRREERARIRARLKQRGLDPDEILSPGNGNNDAAGDH